MPLVVNKDPDTFRSGFAFWNSQTDVMSLATPSDRKVIFAATLFICVRSSFPLLDFFVTGDPDNRLPNTECGPREWTVRSRILEGLTLRRGVIER